jgi:hypothetical protein
VQGTSARSVEDPVEAGCKDEEGEAVKDFVVDVYIQLEGGKTGVTCCCEEEEESSWYDVSYD